MSITIDMDAGVGPTPKPALVWTTETPKAPGFYWRRWHLGPEDKAFEAANNADAWIDEVIGLDFGGRAITADGSCYNNSDWAGPLVPPA